VRDVWISPALPADRSALAAQLPPDLTLSDASAPPPDAIVVVSGYESERIRTLSFRDPGTALVVVCAPDTPAQAQLEGRQPEVLTTASTVGEVVQAIRQASTASAELPWWVSPSSEQSTATTWMPGIAEPATAAEQPSYWQRHRAALLSATAVVLALLIGIVVVIADKNDSPASAASQNLPGSQTQQQPNTGTNPFSGGAIPSQGSGETGTGGTGSQGGTGTTPQDGSSTAPQDGTGTTPQGGTGTDPQGGTGSQTSPFGSGSGGFGGMAQDFFSCLRSNGVDVNSRSALRQLDLSDPSVQSALQNCAQQALGGGFSDGSSGGTTPNVPAVPSTPASPSGSTKTTTST
jgi:hypothetical protein